MSGGAFVVELAVAAIKKIRNRPKAVARRAERAARRAAKTGQAAPVESEGGEIMQGYKTYTGIVVAAIGVVLGWVGVGAEDASSLAGQIGGAIDQIMTIGGLLLAAYGRAKAAPK